MVNLTGASTSEPIGSQTIQMFRKTRVRYACGRLQSPCSVRSPHRIPERVIGSGSEHVTLELSI